MSHLQEEHFDKTVTIIDRWWTHPPAEMTSPSEINSPENTTARGVIIEQLCESVVCMCVKFYCCCYFLGEDNESNIPCSPIHDSIKNKTTKVFFKITSSLVITSLS